MPDKTEPQGPPGVNAHGAVLIITPFFSPNVGGVETRFNDITSSLDRQGLRVWVQTYQPIVTRNAHGDAYEKRGERTEIWRLPWPGGDLFHRLLARPLLCALYLCPGLLVRCFFFLMKRHRQVRVIHAAGFNAALIARLLTLFFNIPFVVTVHALYNFEQGTMGQRCAKWILGGAHRVLAMSKTSREDMLSVGLDEGKVAIHTNWIDTQRFRPLDRDACKERLGLAGRFVIVMIGRLMKIKGVELLLDVARRLPHKDMCVVIAGEGEMSERIAAEAEANEQLIYLGSIPNAELPETYGAADVSIVPSVYPEGFSRVVIESLCCGLPVVASAVGLIPEEVDDSCSILVEPGVEQFSAAIETLYNDPARLSDMSRAARAYGVEHFSERNMSTILEAYGIAK